MRADVRDYQLVSQPTLAATLSSLAEGTYSPLAGGTELMVALAGGRLPRKPLLSIQHLRELRFVQVSADAITLGSGTTFTDMRSHSAVIRDLPLLAQAASWTGSIANQNRGTLGGNLVNASPAADSPPALLVYDASITLISAAGTRTMPYSAFHLGYKRTALRPDELLYSVTVPSAWAGYRQFIRKVGTRNAQAISKVALAVVTRVESSRIADIRIAGASLRDTPFRCDICERALTGLSLGAECLEQTLATAQSALTSEIRPIDDIRSTSAYRSAVAGNLLQQALRAAAQP